MRPPVCWYSLTFAGRLVSGLPVGSVTMSEMRPFQLSKSESFWKIFGQVDVFVQVARMPSVLPVSGSKTVWYVNGKSAPG